MGFLIAESPHAAMSEHARRLGYCACCHPGGVNDTTTLPPMLGEMRRRGLLPGPSVFNANRGYDSNYNKILFGMGGGMARNEPDLEGPVRNLYWNGSMNGQLTMWSAFMGLASEAVSTSADL